MGGLAFPGWAVTLPAAIKGPLGDGRWPLGVALGGGDGQTGRRRQAVGGVKGKEGRAHGPCQRETVPSFGVVASVVPGGRFSDKRTFYHRFAGVGLRLDSCFVSCCLN